MNFYNLFLIKEEKQHPRGIRQEPADRDGPPDSGSPEGRNWCEHVRKKNTGSQGNDGEDNGNSRPAKPSVKAVEQEEKSNGKIAGAFDAQVACADCYDFQFFGAYKDKHEPFCKQKDNGGDKQAEQEGAQEGGADTFLDPVSFAGTQVLGDKGGKTVAEVLDRHVGKGIDFNCGGKGGHDRDAEAVDQSLDHKDAKIHYRLLDAGQEGILKKFF